MLINLIIFNIFIVLLFNINSVGYCNSFGNVSKNVFKVTLGGSQDDFGKYIQQTKDGGYIVIGSTASKGAGEEDIWVIKLSEKGEVVGESIFGDSNHDSGNCIKQTEDGGYIIVGMKRKGYGSGSSIWIIKIDLSGKKEWEETYKYQNYYASSYYIEICKDGGYLISGSIEYAENKNLYRKLLILNLNRSGKKEWDYVFEDSLSDYASNAQQTMDNGYIVIGKKWIKSSAALFVTKLNARKQKKWERTYGGDIRFGSDPGCFVQQTQNGEYIVAARKSIKKYLNIPWILKLDNTGHIIWEKKYSSEERASGGFLQLTKDGGYIFCDDIRILKLDNAGQIEWERKTKGYSSNCIIQTQDGGYILTGIKYGDNTDLYIKKMDRNGLCIK